jgi:hypothetical protein
MNHLLRREAPKGKRSCWTGACFSRGWGNGPVRRLRRWYSGAPGLHLYLMPMPAFGLTEGVLVAAGGSIDGVPVAVDGSTVPVAAGGSTGGVLVAAGG